MLEVLVNGCNGKMGQIVCDLVNQNESLVLNSGEFNFPVYTDISEISKKPDVIIDFSVPCATLNILKYAKQNNVPIVIATTRFFK